MTVEVSEVRVSIADLVGCSVALIGAALLLYLRSSAPLTTPEKTIGAFLGAASSGDVPGIARSATPEYYQALVRRHGEVKLARVSRIHERAEQLGRIQWAQYRQRAESLAAGEYYRLLGQVEATGREALLGASGEHRLQLMADPAAMQRFVVERGVASLSPSDRERLGPLAEVRRQDGLASFVDRNGWGFLSPDDRAVIGDPRALASTDNEKRREFVDRVGSALLDEPARAEIAGIPRTKLANRDAFRLEHGPPLLAEHLRGLGLTSGWVPVRPPRFASDAAGSLIRGDVVTYDLVQLRTEGDVERSLELRRIGSEWRVAKVTGAEIDAPMSAR